ncbi:GrpB family protein [Paenibacillus soyae]|uniref:GrpB family protein n=1 Tax=Paenibacillus soyae TaxID=2969249 RepID=A0A9X2SA90_9BACL|nr:GrpB family protein [Paenibacillus soyae]MCR2805941.1 GrpB family protein [Paenibacillus soyae]
MADPIIVTPYNPEWVREFNEIGTRIRQELGDTAIRIDHIGSTSISGLAAKPIIDIQISVKSLEPVDLYRGQMESLGYVFRADNTERTKRYFRESNNMRRTHIHIREAGSFSEQFALLFRDYLRSHSDDAKYYEATKYRLMELYRNDRHRYVEEKEPIFWEIIRKASRWSQEVGWKPGKSDY